MGLGGIVDFMKNLLGEKIKLLRKKSNLSQKALGKIIGVSDRAVSKWENDLSRPSTENFLQLSLFFDVQLKDFFKFETEIVMQPVKNGMESLKELYKIGRGPSSSHTIGPERACAIFKKRNKDADEFEIILYGSLAKTGRGHGTDIVIKKTLSPINAKIKFDYSNNDLPHPNTMDIVAYSNGEKIDSSRILSVGGGTVLFEYEDPLISGEVYKQNKFSDISNYCKKKSIKLWQYAEENEDSNFWGYMFEVWSAMKTSIKNGLSDDGVLPGKLNVQKKAKFLFNNQHIDESNEIKENRLVCSYAFAVSEQNAAGETVVTAPTCGAAGVLPAVLYYQQQKNNFTDEQIMRALATAGIIGNLIKTNASISGAECGCQAEIGSACAMAAVALAELFDLSIDKIEYAAEIAIEHHLGLTCDPICGLVQIPCIERNAVAAMRAINAVNLSSFLWNTRKISFDKIVETMKETGHDLSSSYRETSEAGLAKIIL